MTKPVLRQWGREDWERLVAAGYHCEHRTCDDCEYRPAPHFIDGRYCCDKCKPQEQTEGDDATSG